MAIAQAAAKIHVPASAVDKKTNAEELSYWLQQFEWKKQTKMDGQTLKLMTQLKKDIGKFVTTTPNTVLVHGDLHMENLLKTKTGKYSVLDWDYQSYGRPERDTWWVCLRPADIKSACRSYKATASKPIDEKLVTAYGLVVRLRWYAAALERQKKRPSQLKSDAPVIRIAAGIARLAKSLYDLTGKQIYADTVAVFSNTEKHRSRPKIRPSSSCKPLAPPPP